MESQTLNLKVGNEVFPVKKTQLLENLGLFKDFPSLLTADDYNIQTRTPLPVHASFVNIIEGGPVTLSEESCESFRLLAEEFGFEALLSECASFMISPFRSSWFHFFRTSGFCAVESDVESERASVTIKVEGEDRTFESLRSAQEAEDFSVALIYAYESDIVIHGIEGRDHLMEKAIAVVYWNTVTSFPDGDGKKAFLVFVLWEIQHLVYFYSIDSVTYCLNRIREIAPTSFDQAKLLLWSQCDPRYPDEFVQVPNPSWSALVPAIHLMKLEKKAKRDANCILQKLKDSGGRWRSFIEGWKPEDALS
jgi:hypothetical protein